MCGQGRAQERRQIRVWWKGPYFVLGQGEQKDFYVVQDPADLCEYSFHISRLAEYDLSRTADPIDIIALDDGEDVIEEILKHKMPSTKKSTWQFLCKWRFDPEPSWEPWSAEVGNKKTGVRNCPALDEYAKKHPKVAKMIGKG